MSDRPHRRVDPHEVARGLRRSAQLLESDHPDTRTILQEVSNLLADGLEAREQRVSRGEDKEPVEDPIHSRPLSTPIPITTRPAPQVGKADPVTILRDGFTCPTAWSSDRADVVIICCSSEQYELQHQELIHALGYRMPHFIQVPGGPAVFSALAAVKGFLGKAMGTYVDKAVELLKVIEVVLIAHEECGAYKPGRVAVIAELGRRMSGKSLKDVQIEHLQKAARELRARLGANINVHSFYGHRAPAGQAQLIRFEPIQP